MKKRLLSMLLAASLLLSLAACGGQGQSSSSAQSSGTGSSSAASQTEGSSSEAQEGETADPGHPLSEEEIFAPYEETVTLSIARQAVNGNNLPDGDEFETNQYIQWLEKELNMKIEFSYLATDSDSYNTRINLMTTTDDLPDVAFVNRQQYEAMVEADLLADMTDIIPQYSSQLIHDYYTSYDNRPIEYAKINGRAYAIPNAKPQDSQPLLWVRKDWREKLNLDVPETLDDVVALADAFVNQDPDGNGQNDTVGLIADKSLNGVGGGFTLNAMFNVFGSYPRAFVRNDAGEIVYGSTQPETKEALKLLADMYQKGTLEKELASRDWNANAGLVSSGQAGMFFYPWHGAWMASDAVRANPEAEWEMLAAPVGEDGKLKIVSPEPVSQYLVVSKKCKHPEAVMKLLSKEYQGLRMLDEEGAKIYYGLGVSWENWPIPLELNYRDTVYEDALSIKEAVETGSTDKLKPSMVPNYENYVTYLEEGAGAMDTYGNAIAFVISAEATGNPAYEMIEEAYYGMTDTKSMKFSNLTKMEDETFLKIITGDQPVDVFDEFVEKWNKEGGQEILSEMEELAQ